MSSRSLRSLIDFYFLFLNVTKLSKKKNTKLPMYPQKGLSYHVVQFFFFFFLLYLLPRSPHEEVFNLASPLFILALTFA